MDELEKQRRKNRFSIIIGIAMLAGFLFLIIFNIVVR
jgi:hypothetical protein